MAMWLGKSGRSRLVAGGLVCALLGASLGTLLAEDVGSKNIAKDVPARTGGEAKAPTTSTAPATTTAGARKGKIDEEAVVEFLKEHEPDVYKWAMVLKEKDPTRFHDRMKEFQPEVRGLLELQKRNPEWFAVKMKDRRYAFRALQLATDLRNETLAPADRERARDELQKVVASQFEVRQQLRQFELDDQAKRIAELQKQLDKLKTDVAEREKHKTELIQQRIEDLLKRSPKVEW